MKSLRKSLNGNKDNHHHISTPSSPLPALSKPPTAVQPPNKVIRALSQYKSNAPHELSFEKGDFFHVSHDNGGLWYEAYNPMTKSRGYVPSHLFEEFTKGSATSRSPKFATPTERLSHISHSQPSPKLKTYYAIVLHDFAAERADELDAKAGDPVTVVAQSNREWFVAKPIGRLGRPGLIPVSFVDIRDPATSKPIHDVQQLIDSGELPRVEEWKRSILNYKANSIPLGVLDDPSSMASPEPRVSSSPPEPAIMVQGATPLPAESVQQIPDQHPRPLTPNVLPGGILLSAGIESSHYEEKEYWFRVHAIYQPYGPSRTSSLPPAKELVLFRSYNDFYDFQVELLETFPYEAGRPDPRTRILPYMPGPVDKVDDTVTATRLAELDEYLHKLCGLRTYARYILEHALVRSFCALKPGDGDVNVAPRRGELDAFRNTSYAYEEEHRSYADPDTTADQMSRLHVSVQEQNRLSDTSRYEEDTGDSFQSNGRVDGPSRSSSRANHQRIESTTSYRQPTSGAAARVHSPNPSLSYSRTHSPAPSRSGDLSRSRTPLEIDPYEANTASRSSLASSHDPSPISIRSSQAGSVHTAATSMSGRSRSASNAAYNPPISASNPNAAFLKIKIFDRVSEDLVAIRVHPKVTHGQLMDKVQARLGGNVLALRYRDSLNNDFVPLEGDGDLRNWLENTDRHMLYAE